MTKTLFRVICTNAEGARSYSAVELGLVLGTLYDVVADVHAATTERKPNGDASGYLLRVADSGVVLPLLYRRDRFVKEGAGDAQANVGSAGYAEPAINPCIGAGRAYASAPAPQSEYPSAAAEQPRATVGDVVVCTDAAGARSFSKPETMLEQDEEYRIVGDLTDAVTVRKPDGGSSGYVVQRTEDDATLAGVWKRSRFEMA